MKLSTILLATALVLPAGGAFAKGCNGVVNQLVWGCAAWDNNNGPQYPNYRAPAAPVRAPAPSYQPPQSSLISPGNRNGLVSNAGGTLISPGNRNGLISQDGGTMRH